GLKRSRWRRLWRQRIQDHIICAIANIKILVSARRGPNKRGALAAAAASIAQAALAIAAARLKSLQANRCTYSSDTVRMLRRLVPDSNIVCRIHYLGNRPSLIDPIRLPTFLLP